MNETFRADRDARDAGETRDAARPNAVRSQALTLELLQVDASLGVPDRMAAVDATLTAVPRHARPEIACLPELFVTGYGANKAHLAWSARDTEAAIARMAEIARKSGTALVFGGPERDGARLFNSAWLVDADGTVRAHHRKIIIPPNQPSERVFTPGSEVTVGDWNGWRIALLVCFDLEFPECVRAASLQGADIVIVISALWTRAPIVMRQVAPVRAFESTCYLACVNYAGAGGGVDFLGESCIIAPSGEPLASAPSRSAGRARATLTREDLAAARQAMDYTDLARRLASVAPESVAKTSVAGASSVPAQE